MKTLFLFLFLCSTTFAVYNVGDQVGESCYEKLDGGQFCLSYGEGAVRVIVNNAGWCPPCNDELKELGKSAHLEFNPMEVIFISLSAEGYSRNTKPDQTFLASWKEKHKIPFIVAGDYKNFGKDYFSSPAIPNVAILDRSGKLFWKAIGPEVSEVYAEVRKALATY